MIENKKPNILFIFTDQQHAGMLGCAGNPYVNTPNLDELASAGARFECAYCANPVCIPSRFSMMTGVYPSRIGMEINDDISNPVPIDVLSHSMGVLLREAGYQTVYGGKTHLPGPEGIKHDARPYGFDYLTHNDRMGLAEACADFIGQRHDRPFLLVASFINPHDICYMAVNDLLKKKGLEPIGDEAWECLKEALTLPSTMDEETFINSYCPPLPDNHEVPENELSALMDDKLDFMHYVRNEWDERMWRLHRWAYARLTERVDAEIGIVLDAIRDTELEDNTLIIFTSDHGDQDGSHRLEHKPFLYEEVIRVPFIVKWNGKVTKSLVDESHLICTGIDIIPSICHAAGIDIPKGLVGRSVLPLVEGDMHIQWRDHIIVECHMSRLVHMGRWKYMVGRDKQHNYEDCLHCKLYTRNYEPKVREMLIDLETDPGEMLNRAEDPDAFVYLERGRRLLVEWMQMEGHQVDPHYII